MYLFLNTSSAEHIDFLFATAKKILLSKHLLQPRGKRIDVLYELSKALKKLKKTPQNIRGIAVVVGPGYFSHLRTGIAIANTFTFVQNTRLLGIPTHEFPQMLGEVQRLIIRLQSVQSGVFLMPAYGKEPTITMKKK